MIERLRIRCRRAVSRAVATARRRREAVASTTRRASAWAAAHARPVEGLLAAGCIAAGAGLNWGAGWASLAIGALLIADLAADGWAKR